MTHYPRLLVLVRHAQAKNSSTGGDRERELTKSGRRMAQAVGAWLAKDGVRPDLAVCSPATRTVSTCEELARGGLHLSELWGDASLYDADVEDVLGSIRDVPDEVRSLLLVGHAPAIPGVAAEVEDHTGVGADELRRRLLDWPPAGVGVIIHDGPWASFPDHSSALVVLREPPEEP